jgi:hypothetical protein
MRQTWTIDVCRTCGKQAKWPFCEHRKTTSAGQPWYTVVIVSGTWEGPTDER